MSARNRDGALIGVLLLLGAIPLFNLMGVPAFVDEGAQLQLIWRALEAGEWLAPVAYGKPLEVWPMVPLMHIGGEPLAAIRAVHVLAGMIGAVLVYQLARRMAGRWTASTCAILFVLCPFVVYLERLALADILLCTLGLWVMLCVANFLQVPAWKHSAVLAVALVIGAVCKLPVGFVLLDTMPLAVMLMPREQRRALMEGQVLRRALAAHAPAIVLALLVFGMAFIRMRRGLVPGFGLQDLIAIGAGPQYDIAATIGVARPTLAGELAAQLSWPVLLLALPGLAVSAFQPDWRPRWLLATGLLPLLAIGLIPRFWYARYLLFTLPPLIICSVLGWRAITQRIPRFGRSLAAAILAVCAVLLGRQSALLVFEPSNARWSALDRFQYFEGWSSGYGFPEAARYVLRAAPPRTTIYSLDGPGAYQLRNYLPLQWGSRVSPVLYGHNGAQLRTAEQRADNLLGCASAWLIVPEPLLQYYMDSDFGRAWAQQLRLRRLVAFDKPGARTQLALYEITRAP